MAVLRATGSIYGGPVDGQTVLTVAVLIQLLVRQEERVQSSGVSSAELWLQRPH